MATRPRKCSASSSDPFVCFVFVFKMHWTSWLGTSPLFVALYVSSCIETIGPFQGLVGVAFAALPLSPFGALPLCSFSFAGA